MWLTIDLAGAKPPSYEHFSLYPLSCTLGKLCYAGSLIVICALAKVDDPAPAPLRELEGSVHSMVDELIEIDLGSP